MTRTLYALLDRLFDHEIIDGHGRKPYLHRWILRRGRRSRWYLHHFIGSDWTRDLHDHPKDFVSIGLWGSYVEYTTQGRRRFVAPWVRRFPATHRHRLELEPGRTAWTLVRVGPQVRQWGFWHAGEWMPWDQYVFGDYAERTAAGPPSPPANELSTT